MTRIEKRLKAQKQAYVELCGRLDYFAKEYDFTTVEIMGILELLMFNYTADATAVLRKKDIEKDDAS